MWMVWLTLFACQSTVQTELPPAEEAPAVDAPKPGPAGANHAKTYEAELAALDRRLAFFEGKAKQNPNSLSTPQAAGLLGERAALTGDYADFERAFALIDAALIADDRHSRAWAARAGLNFSLHRYAEMTEDLSKTKWQKSLEGALLVEQGKYDEAEAILVKQAESKQPQDLNRLAIFRWKTGDLEAAHALLDEAERRYHGPWHRTRAWIHLHRGIFDLDQGNYDEAMAHYRDAEKELAGYWLIEEHIAEIHLLKGELDEAHALYADLIERTGSPEFMDRQSEVLEAQGKPEEAAAMVARARAAYEERLASWPEATWGHALDHWLAHGEPAEALEMAKKNHDNRPNGEAKLGLAHAYLKVGQPGEARKLLGELRASRFRSPEIDELAAELDAK